MLEQTASDVFMNTPQNNGAVQPELNLFAVQMVAQPHYSAQLALFV